MEWMYNQSHVSNDQNSTPTSNTLLERYHFHQRCQQSEEDLSTFVNDVLELAKTCDFGDQWITFVRDRVVFGLYDDDLKWSIIRGAIDPSLTDVMNAYDLHNLNAGNIIEDALNERFMPGECGDAHGMETLLSLGSLDQNGTVKKPRPTLPETSETCPSEITTEWTTVDMVSNMSSINHTAPDMMQVYEHDSNMAIIIDDSEPALTSIIDMQSYISSFTNNRAAATIPDIRPSASTDVLYATNEIASVSPLLPAINVRHAKPRKKPSYVAVKSRLTREKQLERGYLECPECEGLIRPCNFNRHMEGKPLLVSTYICYNCDASFGRENLLMAHYEMMHAIIDLDSNETQFLCTKCGDAERSPNALRDHLHRHHGLGNEDASLFKCRECDDRIFDDIESFTAHTAVHYVCDICNARSRTPYLAKVHRIGHWKAERPFECFVCHYRFDNIDVLIFHLRDHDRLSYLRDAEKAMFITKQKSDC